MNRNGKKHPTAQGSRLKAVGKGFEPPASSLQPMRGQALIELAVMGSFLLFGLALMVRFGMSFYNTEQNAQEAFRFALKEAYDTRAYNGFPSRPAPEGVLCAPGSTTQTHCTRPELVPGNNSQVMLVKERHIPNPSNPFASGIHSSSISVGSVRWGSDSSEFYPYDTANNSDLPKFTFKINDKEFKLLSSRFRVETFPYSASTGTKLCAYYDVYDSISPDYVEVIGPAGEVLESEVDFEPCDTSQPATVDVGTRISKGTYILGGGSCTGGVFEGTPPSDGVYRNNGNCTGGQFVNSRFQTFTGGSYTGGSCEDGTYTGAPCTDGICTGGTYTGGNCVGGTYYEANPVMVRVNIIDACMADVIDPQGCQSQCNKIQAHASQGLQLPGYCNASPINPLVKWPPQGLDMSGFTRKVSTNNTFNRKEDSFKVRSSTNINETDTVSRKIRTNPNVTPDYPISVDANGPYIDATSSAVRSRNYQWRTNW